MFTILKSKLRPPGLRRDVIDRAPLLLRLDTAAGSAAPTSKVILISAAPGYGKSTLLALWGAHLSAQGTPVVWYNLSPGDRALPVFLAYLDAGLRGALPGFARHPAGGPTPVLTLTDPALEAAGDSVTVESLVSPLVAALETSLGGDPGGPPSGAGRPRLLIVLDDLHYVAGHPAIDRALSFLMRALPAGVVLAVSSRRDLGAGLPIARLRGYGAVTTIGEEELRLLPSEAIRAFPLLASAANRQALARLIEKLEGWPLGLHIAHEFLAEEHLASRHGDAAGAQIARRITDDLYAYFGEEVLAPAGEPLYSFLLRTAVLDEITVPAADVLSERSGSEVFIAQAQREHLLLRRIGLEPAVYRYHPLFCEFLATRLTEMYGHEEKLRLHRLAAAHFAGTGAWIAAAQQFLAAGDVDGALAAVNMVREQAGAGEDGSRAPLAPPSGSPLQDLSPGEVLGYRLHNTGDPQVRRRLVELLGRQAVAEDIPLLEAFGTDTDPAVRDTAQAVLAGLVRRTTGILRIAMFGGLQLARGDARVDEREWRRKRAKLLLVYLLLAGPDGASRQTIAEKVWPEALPGEADDQFYAHLRALRGVLDAAPAKEGASSHIRNQGGRYAFAFDSPHQWDLAEFLRYRDQGRRAERLGRGAEAAAAYEAAVALYMGDLLPEPLFRDVAWLHHLRAACREDMLSMRTFLAEHAADAHDWAAALVHWKAILQVEPAREVVHARMMTVYAWLGRRDDAIAQFQVCRAALRRELGADPLPSTVDLYQQIMSNTTMPRPD
jgi:DNA-binding SARP family transcriptional activator